MIKDTRLEHLIGLLKQEIDLYQSLQVVIDQEKEAALSADLSGLNETALEKEKILLELHKMEENRRQLLANLAGSLGVAGQVLTLSKISQLVGDPLAGNLRRIRQDFLSVVSTLQEANRRNKRIFEHAAVLLRGSYNLLNDLLTPNTVYFRTGNVQNMQSSGQRVCREI